MLRLLLRITSPLITDQERVTRAITYDNKVLHRLKYALCLRFNIEILYTTVVVLSS